MAPNEPQAAPHPAKAKAKRPARPRAEVTRKGTTPIKVWVLPEEKALIELNAAQHGLSASAFLRRVGMGMEARGTIDQSAIRELAKINGDQGRLGGLLKLWLTDDKKLAVFDQAQLRKTIEEMLRRIESLQDEMREKLSQL